MVGKKSSPLALVFPSYGYTFEKVGQRPGRKQGFPPPLKGPLSLKKGKGKIGFVKAKISTLPSIYFSSAGLKKEWTTNQWKQSSHPSLSLAWRERKEGGRDKEGFFTFPNPGPSSGSARSPLGATFSSLDFFTPSKARKDGAGLSSLWKGLGSLNGDLKRNNAYNPFTGSGLLSDAAYGRSNSMRKINGVFPWVKLTGATSMKNKFGRMSLEEIGNAYKQVFGRLESKWGKGTAVFFSLALPIFIRKQWINYRNDFLPVYFDMSRISQYFGRRPFLVVARMGVVSSKVSWWLIKLSSDYIFGNLVINERVRANELVAMFSELGAIFIKVGQALSVRVDLLSPAYVEACQTLQDQVPPFCSNQALRIITKDLGEEPSKFFRDMDAFKKPIAAASLGQVYRAELKDGTQVAVKVQRPDMVLKGSLDILILVNMLEAMGRMCGGLLFCLPRWSRLAIMSQTRSFCLGMKEVLLELSGRYFEELDYENEARNCIQFRNSMSRATIGDAVFVPYIYESLTARHVLTSEWIVGEKLSHMKMDTPEARARMKKVVSILLNSYLVQLLETGFLHADPHPGNFILTPNGKVCVLDFGLMQTISEDRQMALLEFVVDLNTKNYDGTMEDLIKLGFLPPSMRNDEDLKAKMVPTLQAVFQEFFKGGGAGSINVEFVKQQMEQLLSSLPSKSSKGMKMPAYFALIMRTFGTIEGLGICIDKNFEIVQESFPYLAKRLLTDNSSRMQQALKSFLYGSESQLKVERLNDMIEAYRSFRRLSQNARIPLPVPNSYSKDGSPGFRNMASDVKNRINKGLALGIRKKVVWPASSSINSNNPVSHSSATITQEALQLLFARDGNYVQDLLVDEIVKLSNAAAKGAAVSAVQSARKALAFSYLPLLRSLRTNGKESKDWAPGMEDMSLFNSVLSVALTPVTIPLIPFLPFLSAIANKFEETAALTAENKRSLDTVQKLINLAQHKEPQQQPQHLMFQKEKTTNPKGGLLKGGFSILEQTASTLQMASSVAPMIPSLVPGGLTLLKKFVSRLSDNIINPDHDPNSHAKGDEKTKKE